MGRHAPSSSNEITLSVLVVEDDLHTREMMVEMLVHAGLDVWACASVTEALARAARSTPHVVITDLALGDEHGRDLAAALRARAETRRAAIIAVTGEVSPTPDVVRHLDAYLCKPIELAKLPDLVRAIAEARGAI
ncbi:response regulator [Sandaracinus amylolyticus]|uniref:Chemotaxis protein methyltransferase CheR n=1 Tax=Sandaracinus amylolyticus TaxID=927083 RepID=A0A0F6W799_9BACT|nr:response regulator [Sandaracinus amylolyticus]AKF09115.1 Chemotaxis protein methyltransferase CheR [Sandaracinus amylolyticus]